MNASKIVLTILISGGILSGICPSLVHAGALYIYEMGNATDTGYAGAGLAARANDAGTVFTNPAGMTRFKESAILAGATPLYIYAPFDPDANTTASGSKGSVKEFFAGGSFAYLRPVSDKLTLGISAQNFFGLALDWKNKWVGRYEVTKGALIAPQLQPTVAYKVTDWLSIGAGAGLTLGYLADRARIKNLEPNLSDGKLKYDDTDFAVQGNFGIMFEPSEGTRIGLRYLTETDLDFDADIFTSGVGPGIAALTQGGGRSLDLGMKMPQSIMTGIYHRLNDKWAVLGSFGWDDWSRFGRVRVRIDDTGVNTVVDAGFDDTWHFGVGAEHQVNPKLTLTAGFSYDSAMATSSTRAITLPLGEMYRYGVGLKYRKRDDLTLGGGLSLLWEGDLPIKPVENGLSGDVSGEYQNVRITFLSFYAQWH
jgi:long-chain fatty acid transport protein